MKFKFDKKLDSKLHDMKSDTVFNLMLCKSIGNGQMAIIDGLVTHEKLMEKVFIEYFVYKFDEYERHHGH